MDEKIEQAMVLCQSVPDEDLRRALATVAVQRDDAREALRRSRDPMTPEVGQQVRLGSEPHVQMMVEVVHPDRKHVDLVWMVDGRIVRECLPVAVLVPAWVGR